MQPHCRRFSFDNDLPAQLKDSYDLSDIKSPGKSGLVTVLIGLKWWAGVRETDSRWIEAVRDVSACLGHIVAHS